MSPEQRSNLEKDLLAGVFQHSELARKYQLTRERVRQIANEINAPNSNSIRKAKTSLKKYKNQLIKQEKFQQYKANLNDTHLKNVNTLSQLYIKKTPIQTIAQQLNRSEKYIRFRISQLRKRYPNLFPYHS
jgi:hypothetical protein